MRFYKNYTAYFIHDGPSGQLIGEYYNGNIVSRHVPGAAADEPVGFVGSSGARTFYHADERGSVIAGSNDSGANARIVPYDEYGKRGSGGSYRFAYTGQNHLINDIYDFKSRNYNARLGRFLQADSIGYSGGMNLYAYVGGDPINASDPRGLNPKDDDGDDGPPIFINGHAGGGGVGGGGSASFFGSVSFSLAPSDLVTADTPSIFLPTCDTPGADPFNCAPVVNGSPQREPSPTLPPMRLSFAPSQSIPGLSQSECAALVWGLVAAGLLESVEAAIHLLRGASIVETFFAVSSASATARFVLIGVAAGGTIYLLDRLTGGTISSKVGRLTGICP
jgi:RHS repeat-associated protein